MMFNYRRSPINDKFSMKINSVNKLLVRTMSIIKLYEFQFLDRKK